MIPSPKPSDFKPYHTKRETKRKRSISPSEREFVAWDGEGVNLRGDGYPQSYVLFGSTKGSIESPSGLTTLQCLAHIIETGRRFPAAIHIGFAFGYDANMICQSLSPSTLARLHRNGSAMIRSKELGCAYRLTYLKGKVFQVTQYLPQYDHKHNPTAKTTVKIFDIFSFFMSSFVTAYEKNVGPVPEIVVKGKQDRGTLGIADLPQIRESWEKEIVLVKELADALREKVYTAGLNISQWHGPGALSSYAMKQHRIQDHMKESNDEIREAARFAYAAGRFERFKVGRISGRTVYGVDINSAYPTAIALLPSLSHGKWVHVTNPESVARFGVYRLSLSKFTPMAKRPSPVFHRDRNGNISFPWRTDGWYWSPEAHSAQLCGATVHEGWEFHPDDDVRPFEWVRDMYGQRRLWKAEGISAELALKLCLNAAYGKLAQRVGWDEETGRKPPFHQLEWAGWITSYTRNRLFQAMSRAKFEDIIAVETDGFYTTAHPSTLGITIGENLGQWSLNEYDEVMYVQSGLAWLHGPKGWEQKRRGLDPCRKDHSAESCTCSGTFSLNACRDFLAGLQPNSSWAPYKGETSRFVGMGQALASRHPLHYRHCLWETVPREIHPGDKGKRVHVPKLCGACTKGMSAHEGLHDMVIRSLSVIDPQSYEHHIPWESSSGPEIYEWEEQEMEDDGYVYNFG